MAATSSLLSISSASLHFSPNPTTPKMRRKPPPISISTNPSHVDPLQLQDLLRSANFSCHRFPALAADGRAEPVDTGKLQIALAHSFVVVSVFCRPKYLVEDDKNEILRAGIANFFERALPVPESDSRLVGFGRAVSDGGLTASIHDIVLVRDSFYLVKRKNLSILSPLQRPAWKALTLLLPLPRISKFKHVFQVIPSLQRRGIGQKIVERIIRLFFKACGFGGDSLGSTTMMYTRSALSYLQGNLMVRPAGRLLLLVPPSRGPTSEVHTEVS
ncbi:GCN5-related N-acetyltransferase 3, chloroplastic-like isoform X2 [Elaeis guineensis]|uniref:GCN5-related N-acetyltransferase 3, chloroplastic isoform X2 n=1 Tax=Elaeis guineensis var. tenera TaxID=51953 RepID=UPI003C6D1CF8